MGKFSLEVENWGSWEWERDFSNLDRAKAYGLERFPHNEWHIIDLIDDNEVFRHSTTEALEEVASGEAARFRQTEHWRNYFAERYQDEGMARQLRQRQRMDEVAAGQRNRQAQAEAVRRERLQGFQFVGRVPAILFGRWSDDVEPWGEDRSTEPKANWLKEGF
jgi:hypothetical protein